MKAKDLIEFLSVHPDAEVSVGIANVSRERDGSFTESAIICGASSVRYEPDWEMFDIVGVESEVAK